MLRMARQDGISRQLHSFRILILQMFMKDSQANIGLQMFMQKEATVELVEYGHWIIIHLKEMKEVVGHPMIENLF